MEALIAVDGRTAGGKEDEGEARGREGDGEIERREGVGVEGRGMSRR